MRFSTIFAAGLVAVASAQDTTASSTSSVAETTTFSISPEQSSTLACLDACADGDVDCEAQCVPVPNPSEEMISQNNACIADCPTGNGTEADNSAYSVCQAGCIASYYYTASGELAGATGSATASADGSDSTSDSDSSSGDSDSEDASSTDSADGAESTEDTGAAGALGVPSAAFSLGAFLLAFIAL